VLFVDDDPNVLSGLRRMLRSCRDEWQMDFASCGQEALQAMRTSPPDVVVTDMRMPGMDGAELLEEVRKVRPNTVRLVLSGHSDRELTLRAVGPAHQYLAKPCDPEVLRETIRNAVQLQQSICTESVQRLVEGVVTLPTLPAAYVMLVEELTSAQPCLARAGKLIASDLGMSAKVLQLVNSSFFGLPVRVGDVSQAVALLGLDVVRPLTLSTGVFRQYEGRDLGGLSLSRLMNHSLNVAVTAKGIATRSKLDRDAADEAFLAGLLHDVGRLILAQADPIRYARVVAIERRDPIAVTEAEQREFGASHGELGGYLLGLWGMPRPIVEAVALHHSPGVALPSGMSPLASVHAAEAIVASETTWDTAFLERFGLHEATERHAADLSANHAGRL
jgi:HD-like signal output (HDOD) protein